MFIKISVILLLFLLETQFQVDAKNILSVFPTQSLSHYIFITPLLKQLAERGHQVTSISPYPQSKPIKNFRDIALLDQYKGFSDVVRDSQDMRDMSLWQLFTDMHKLSPGLVKSVMAEQQIQQLLRDPQETFDLVIIDVCFVDAFFGFAAHFGAPLVGVATFGAHSWNTALTGAPTLPAFMPFPFLGHDDLMTFYQRLHNFYAYVFEYFFVHFIHLPRHEKIFEQHFGHTGYTLADVRRNFSLVLLNQHSSLGVSRPYLPNMIEVGGMQVSSQINTLPDNIQQFLDNATEGAIYFSLGTNVKSAKLSPVKLNAIINTFRSLPQRILWKLEVSNLTDMPENVFISSWFPQTDVLAHPNIKMFITHGGLMSITESIVRGKPLLGMPFFADQFMNMERAKRLGYALSLDFNDFSETNFLHAIQELLSNASYAQMAKTLSQRYHDKPQTALETAIYWVEYVLRHNGAPHLRCVGMNLNILQYYGLDVAALVLMVVVILMWMAYKVLYKLYAVICGSDPEQKKTKFKTK